MIWESNCAVPQQKTREGLGFPAFCEADAVVSVEGHGSVSFIMILLVAPILEGIHSTA